MRCCQCCCCQAAFLIVYVLWKHFAEAETVLTVLPCFFLECPISCIFVCCWHATNKKGKKISLSLILLEKRFKLNVIDSIDLQFSLKSRFAINANQVFSVSSRHFKSCTIESNTFGMSPCQDESNVKLHHFDEEYDKKNSAFSDIYFCFSLGVIHLIINLASILNIMHQIIH